jgi:hypothetical protein
VKSDTNKLDHFIEIELDEATIHTLSYDAAMDVIRKYESILESVGVEYRGRLSKSLFEMYVKESKPKDV